MGTRPRIPAYATGGQASILGSVIINYLPLMSFGLPDRGEIIGGAGKSFHWPKTRGIAKKEG
jgi:hypothetical protein